MPINGGVKEDLLNEYLSEAIEILEKNHELIDKIKLKGVPWLGIVEALVTSLPSSIDERERNKIAYANVRPALDKIFSEGNWENDRRPKVSGAGTTVWDNEEKIRDLISFFYYLEKQKPKDTFGWQMLRVLLPKFII